MSRLLADPQLVLATKEETLAYIEAGTPAGVDKYKVKSQWLCDLLNKWQGEKGGRTVYNSEAQRRVELENGLPQFPENGSILSSLIYAAQGYRDSDNLKADGWAYLTPEMVQEAIERKARVEVLGTNMLGFSTTGLCRPVCINGEYWVIVARKRKHGFRANSGTVARIHRANNTRAKAKTSPVVVNVA